jgi:hypothetical protein
MVPLWFSRGFWPCWLRIWHCFFDPTFGRPCVVYRGFTFWVYGIPWDMGYDSCRSKRELPEYTKITPHYTKMCHYIGSKIMFFFLSQSKKGTIHIYIHTTRQGLSESPSYDLTWPSVRKKRGCHKIHFFRFWVF